MALKQFQINPFFFLKKGWQQPILDCPTIDHSTSTNKLIENWNAHGAGLPLFLYEKNFVGFFLFFHKKKKNHSNGNSAC